MTEQQQNAGALIAAQSFLSFYVAALGPVGGGVVLKVIIIIIMCHGKTDTAYFEGFYVLFFFLRFFF